MYYVYRATTPRYGLTYKRMVMIEKAIKQSARQGGYIDPVEAVKAAIANRNDWGYKSTRMVVETGNKLLLSTKVEGKINKWAQKEYKSIPKCLICVNLVEHSGDVCSDACEEQNLLSKKMDDNEETEFFL